MRQTLCIAAIGAALIACGERPSEPGQPSAQSIGRNVELFPLANPLTVDSVIATIASGRGLLEIDQHTRPRLIDSETVALVRGHDFTVANAITGEGWKLSNPAGLPGERSSPIYGITRTALHVLSFSGEVLSFSLEDGSSVQRSRNVAARDRAIDLMSGSDLASLGFSEDGALTTRHRVFNDYVGSSRYGLAVEARQYSKVFKVVRDSQDVTDVSAGWPIHHLWIDADERIWVQLRALTSGDTGGRLNDGLVAYQVFDRDGNALFNIESPMVVDASGNRALASTGLGAARWHLIGFR